MKKELIELGFTCSYVSNDAEAWIHTQSKAVACILLSEYIPIAVFRDTFSTITGIIEGGDFETFIFDKRSLRTFHQPSMEWYYIEWKTEVAKMGVYKHRKLLPDLPWFVKAVEIAKIPLLGKLPNDLKERLDITYCKSIEEALR